MPIFEVDVRGAVYEIDAPDEATASQVARQIGTQPQHFDFDASNVPDLNPSSGMVERPSGGVLGDMAASLGSGIRSGAETFAGLPGDINRLAGSGAEWLAGKAGAGPETAGMVGQAVRRFHPTGYAQTSEEVQRRVSDPILGDALTHQPETTPGEYMHTLGEFLPASIAGPGGFIQRLVGQAVLPSVGSETAGQLTEGSAIEGPARVVGAIAGGFTPSAISKAVTPNAAAPSRVKAAAYLQREGIDVTAGQKTGDSNLLRREGMSRGAEDLAQRQAEQFTAAALKRAGIDAKRASDDVIDNAYTQIGKRFDTLASKTDTPFTKTVQDDLLSVVDDYQAASAAVAPGVERIMNRAAELAAKNGGRLSGEAYQNLRGEIRKLSASADPATRNALRDVQNVIDDAVGASMPKEFMGEWQKARREYRNLLVIEDAATRAGEASAAGYITPSALRSAAVRQGKRSYARGKTDFAALARAGEEVLKKIPVSPTVDTTLRGLGRTARGGGIGAAIGTLVGGPGAGSIIGGGIGGALPSVSNLTRLSGPVQSYLGNQVAAGMPQAGGIMNMVQPTSAGIFEGLLQERRKERR